MRVISYGGGVQSTALVVLATQGKIGHVDAALFSNVGDDSEHPATISYVRDVAIPWAAERGLTVHELHRVRRDGTPETLYGRLMKEGSRSLPIPVRMADTGAPGTRSCTADFKIRVIAKWLREHGATEADPATTLIGISTDEIERMHNRREERAERVEYPLIDLRLDRSACAQIIRDAGLPVPPKSACYFCPFHRPSTWAEQRRDEPELFWKAVALERTLNRRRDTLSCPTEAVAPATITKRIWHWSIPDAVGFWTDEPRQVEWPDQLAGHPDAGWWEEWGRCPDCDLERQLIDGLMPAHPKDHVYLTRFGKPLDEAIVEAQASLFDGPEGCDEGYCWT